MEFGRKLAKVLIHNSYINDESCTSTEKKIKKIISHILVTAPNHATDYDRKMSLQQKC